MRATVHTDKGRIPRLSLSCHSANALLLFIPAFILTNACGKGQFPETGYPDTDAILNSSIHLKSLHNGDSGLSGMTADVFFYNDDGLGRIDSYQRLTVGKGNSLDAASRKGRKTAVVICNPQESDYDWTSISSVESLSELYADLRKESPGTPVMSGTLGLQAADDGTFEMEVLPLRSEIVLRSIRCDFSGRPYSGSRLENVHVYLSNINSMAKILYPKYGSPVSPVNTDGLYRESDRTFANPGMVHAVIEDGIGQDTVYPDIRLFCYPNSSREDTAGSPFTRLVISGDIEGMKYYYPLNVNHGGSSDDGNAAGIGRNCRYTFDIVLRNAGTTDPTVPVSDETAGISVTVMPWNTKNENEICF